jgi:hypothetical protein
LYIFHQKNQQYIEVIYKGKLIDPEKALRKVEIVTTKPGAPITNKS